MARHTGSGGVARAMERSLRAARGFGIALLWSHMVFGGRRRRRTGTRDAKDLEAFDAGLKRISRHRPVAAMQRAMLERPWVVFLAVMLAATGVSAALLFNQTLTAPTPVGATLTRNCETVPPTPPTYVVGTDGFVIWMCTGTTAAITVNGAGTVTPTITKASEWTTTFIYKTSGTAPTTGCASASITKALTSGTAVSFIAGDAGGWNYCSDYVDAPNPVSNVVYTWNQ